MSTDFSDIASSLASAGYGDDAASVLATCQTLLDVQEQASQQEFRDFRDAVGWHPKIFSKLLTIGKDERLFDYATDLPASYTAIYALASLNDEEFAAAGEEGVISTSSSVRFINNWVKARRLHGNAVVEEIALTLTVRRSRSAEEVDALLASLKNAADAAGASLRVGSGSVRETVAGERQTTAEQILELLVGRMDAVVASADPALVEQFSVASGEALAKGEMRQFTGFLVRATGSTDAMWQHHGKDYCLKVCLEFNSTTSRAQRFNYKKRLLEVKEKHPELGGTVDQCLEEWCK